MQDLIRIGVPNPGEEARVGQRPLESMVLTGQRRPEDRKLCAQHLQPPPFVRRQSRLALLKIQRRALLGRSLRIKQRPILKIERSQPYLAGDLRALLPPLKPPSDHKVDDDE